jgi:hypothetical protein
MDTSTPDDYDTINRNPKERYAGKAFAPPSGNNFPNRTFEIFLFYYSLMVGLLLSPPIFNQMFSMVQLLEREKPGLWFLSVFLIALALLIRFGRWKGIAFFFLVFNGLLVVSIELGARTIIESIYL